MTIHKDIAAGLFFALWLIDTAATASFVQQYGVTMESNPLMRTLIVTYGMMAFVLLKAGVAAFWFPLYRRAHFAINASLAAIMLPIAYMGVRVAWG